MLKNLLRNILNNSLLFFRNRIGLLSLFAKINKGEGLNKRPPLLLRSFTGGKRNIFPSLKSKKNTLGSRVKNIGKLKQNQVLKLPSLDFLQLCKF